MQVMYLLEHSAMVSGEKPQEVQVAVLCWEHMVMAAWLAVVLWRWWGGLGSTAAVLALLPM